jgi:hypothetical protein
MYPLKQSTAITVPIFVHDANGDAVTGIANGSFTKRISKNGGAFGAMTVTITEMENGWYGVPVSTSHSDTLGLLSMTFTSGAGKQVNVQFRVESRLNSDLATETKQDTIDTVVDGIQTDLSNGTDGLGALLAACATVTGHATEAKQDIIDGVVDNILTDTGTTIPALLATIDDFIDTEIQTLITNLATVDTVVDGIQTDLSNATDGLGALKALIDTIDTVVDLIVADTGTDGVVISAAQMNSIADHVWRRTLANIRASSDGDAVSFRSGLGALAKLTNKVSVVGTDLIIYSEDDSTTFGTQALTTDAAAEPITGVDTT